MDGDPRRAERHMRRAENLRVGSVFISVRRICFVVKLYHVSQSIVIVPSH